MDGLRALAGVPLLDRAVVLQSGIATGPGAHGNLLEEIGGILFLERFSGRDGLGPPVLAIDGGLHELVGDADRKVLVLELDAVVGFPVEGGVVALGDKGSGLLFLQGLAIDEIFNVAVPVPDRVHLGGAACLAPGLYNARDLVIDLKE